MWPVLFGSLLFCFFRVAKLVSFIFSATRRVPVHLLTRSSRFVSRSLRSFVFIFVVPFVLSVVSISLLLVSNKAAKSIAHSLSLFLFQYLRFSRSVEVCHKVRDARKRVARTARDTEGKRKRARDTHKKIRGSRRQNESKEKCPEARQHKIAREGGICNVSAVSSREHFVLCLPLSRFTVKPVHFRVGRLGVLFIVLERRRLLLYFFSFSSLVASPMMASFSFSSFFFLSSLHFSFYSFSFPNCVSLFCYIARLSGVRVGLPRWLPA